MTTTILGIDFGTCRTSAAVFLGGKCEPVPIEKGVERKNDMPTALFLKSSGEVLVGDRARAARPQDISRYHEDFKRRVGSLDRFDHDGRSYAPEDLVSLVLRHVKECAEDQFSRNDPIVEAVLTVPTTYVEGGDQWKAMEKAGRLAGFESVHLVREPDAAAVYYDSLLRGRGLDLQKDGEVTLVYDLGGGTFDPALIRREGDGYRVLRGNEDSYGVACGGNHFDLQVFEHFASVHPEVASQARKVLSGLDATSNLRDRKDAIDLQRFLVDVKAHLSSATDFDGEEPVLGGSYRIGRDEFESRIAPLLDQTMSCCEAMVERCDGVKWESITRILLVGGSSKIPLVEKKLEALRRHHRSSAELCRGRIGTGSSYYDPDLAVSYGAAVAGARLASARTLQQGMSAFLSSPSPSNDADAFRLLSLAASSGECVAWYPLGMLYAEGRGTRQDLSAATNWYRKAAEAGVADAQAALGNCYRLGTGVGQDAEQASAWYCKAVAQGHAKASEALRNLIAELDRAIEMAQGHAKASEALPELEEDNPQGWYAKGEKFRTGQGVAVDMAEAAKWYRKSAEGGKSDAQFYWGYFLANGQGVPKDDGEAFWWYLKAAEQGNSSAQCNLGVCYHNGQGVGKDLDKAKFWYQKAIAQGDEQARKNLAILETPLPPPPPRSCIVPGTNKGTFTDPRDGRVYRAVKIGKQVWMAENLAFNIPGSWVYNNNSANEAKYGRLYNWDAAKAACPPGWHLPTDEEWMALIASIGGASNAGIILKSKDGWKSFRDGNMKLSDWLGSSAVVGTGNDEHGFCAKASGYRDSSGHFHYETMESDFWSATINGKETSAWFFEYNNQIIQQQKFQAALGFSVRYVES